MMSGKKNAIKQKKTTYQCGNAMQASEEHTASKFTIIFWKHFASERIQLVESLASTMLEISKG